MAPRVETHRPWLEPLGLPGDAVQALDAYLQLLAAWGGRTNLTGARTAAERVAVLVRDVAPAAAWLVGPVTDLGSGNGSPGLVLAAVRPDLAFRLVEPRVHRWAFLREAARVMQRPQVEVVHGRHEAVRELPPAASVTLRALKLPLTEIRPLMAEGGRLLVFGGVVQPLAGWSVLRRPAGVSFVDTWTCST